MYGMINWSKSTITMKHHYHRFSLVIFLMLVLINDSSCYSCAPRDYGFGSFVCVCSASYCDTLDVIKVPPNGEVGLYQSSKTGERFSKSILKFSGTLSPGVDIVQIDRNRSYQTILGFGGAFTDSSGINTALLSKPLQDMLISSYYSRDGLEYNMGRVPMASCDFSTHEYSYDDVTGDFNLTHFKLTKEDLIYKIPYIQMAQSASSEKLLLFGSPWSAPSWMKTNNEMVGKGSLKGQPGGKYYQTWANYFVKFLKAYGKENITFWGITAQNEPTDGLQKNFPFQSMGFTPELQRDFIKLNLGPALQKAGYDKKTIKLMILDDNRLMLPKWAEVVLADRTAAQYVSGIGYHWYLNNIAPAKLLDIVHQEYPDFFLLATEACNAWLPWQLPKVALGSWERAEDYAHDIIEDLLHWSVGWIDWNLALDHQGGPNWVKNFVDAPVIVNATANEFYKQPMYYALAHFSKFLPRGTKRIGLNVSNMISSKTSSLDLAAFQTPSNAIILIVVNSQNEDVHFTLQDLPLGYLNLTSPSHTIQSYIWHV